MLAVHLENLLFLLLLVVAGLFQLLGRAARKASTGEEEKPKSKSPPKMSKPIPRAAVESDEERVRKFLEALGNPSASPPPPRTAQRPTYRKPFVLPRARPMASPLPPLVTRPPDLPGEFEVRREPIPIPVERPRTTLPSPEPVFQVHESTAPLAPTPMQPASTTQAITAQPQVAVPRRAIVAGTLLRSKSSLRDAIVIREILGPPRGLKAFELGT
jgi:Na+-transporting methylmalonyl-CoA/oxaloacetate decarboxylase gamma subunit